MAKVAIVGAGPVGLDAALHGARLGHDVRVYERGRIGQNMREWGFVRLFSASRINLTAPTRCRLGSGAPADDSCLTAAEHVAAVLEPLAAVPELAGRVCEHTTVVSIGRERIGKSRPLGPERARHPFRLLLEAPDGERIEHADVVLDCSGTWTRCKWLGSGNVPARGERELQRRIEYRLVDVAGARRAEFEGRRVLVVGAGYSAATALEGLCGLAGTRVLWVHRGPRASPYTPVHGDPLPARARLAVLGNLLAHGGHPNVEFRAGTVVEALVEHAGRLRVTLSATGGTPDEQDVDRVLAHVGFSPDNSLYRELQVHECYASFGPMRLAAALQDEGDVDCMSRAAQGADRLRHPEPGFFVLGAKSYGRHSSFLLRTGFEQVGAAYSLIASPGPNSQCSTSPSVPTP